MTTIILGAGASYGAAVGSAPPLLNNFFFEGKKMIHSDYSILWKLFKRMGYSMSDIENGNPNLEELYSMLHIISTGLWYEDHESFKKDLGLDFWKLSPVKFIESFIVEITSISSLNALSNTCFYHDMLVSKLKTGDSIISFNYDLIADASFKKNNLWNETTGYGFPSFNLMREDENQGTIKLSEILLLKPHGSLNWELQREYPISTNKHEIEWKYFHEKLNPYEVKNKFKIRPYRLDTINSSFFEDRSIIKSSEFYNKLLEDGHNDSAFVISGIENNKSETFIIPPTHYKFGDSFLPIELVLIWSKVRESLQNADEIVIIGYSFPETDLHFNTLFRLATQNSRKSIQIVNPDKNISLKLKNKLRNLEISHKANFLSEYVQKV